MTQCSAGWHRRQLAADFRGRDRAPEPKPASPANPPDASRQEES